MAKRTVCILVVGLMGCWVPASDGDPSSSQMDASSSGGLPPDDQPHGNSGPTPGATTVPEMTTDGGSDPEPPSNFIENPDGGSDVYQCDVFEQDCKEGEKCLAWANDGGSTWNATRCSDLVDDPAQVGEACYVIGSAVSGSDSCDVGAMCWNVDPETLEGTCIGLCTGDPASPVCEDPNAQCSISCDGTLTLCMPTCDPLAQDCAGGDACYPMGVGYFTCAPDVSGDLGAQGEPCEFINVCDPGLTCMSADVVGCDEGYFGCCTAYCEVGAAPCGSGLECMPYFNAGNAPPGLENVGVCIAGA
ncbi:MAG: ribulose phosphate epimerase [Deltaproteobacteria bacterium]|nr:ribulose phosphate epimerase [Deltaproteobacteria bacterium]